MVSDGGIRRGRPPMLGSSRLRSQRPAPERPASPPAGPTGPAPIRPLHLPPATPAGNAPGGRKRVLFLCIGNSCRSQMAEAFAKAYGRDVLEAYSAGLAPAPGIAPLTRHVVALRGVTMEGHFPKGLEEVLHQPFDIIVNLSGQPVRLPAGRILDWPVRDPIGLQEPVYREVAAQIENLVMRLVLELRAAEPPQAGSPNRR